MCIDIALQAPCLAPCDVGVELKLGACPTEFTTGFLTAHVAFSYREVVCLLGVCKDPIFPGDFGTRQRVGVGRMEVE